MARNRITKPATLRRLSVQCGQPVIVALTRGDTGHRVDCLLDDATTVSVYPNGTIEPSDIRIRDPRTTTKDGE